MKITVETAAEEPQPASGTPEWIDIKRCFGAEHGELVREANGQPLIHVSYSPACKAGAPS